MPADRGCADKVSDGRDHSLGVTIYSTKPENPLIPADTNEVGGGNILDQVFRGLVKYNPDTAEPELSMAKPPGLLKRALLPVPSADPAFPAVPANVVTTPAEVILRIW